LRSESKFLPWSVDMHSGTPKRAIQPVKKVSAIVAAV